jgi:hypothetical protein
MSKKEIKTYCSKIADYYFNQTPYRKYYRGQISGSYIVHYEIEKLCKKGIRKISIEELIETVTSAYPEREDLEDRVNRVIKFSIDPPKDKSPDPLLEIDGRKIIIL